MKRASRSLATLALAFTIGCRAAPPPRSSPPEPSPTTLEPYALAAELDGQLAELAAIVHAHRADCPRLAAELRALFARMATTVQRARDAERDPELARQLTAALRTYDESAAARTTSIEADFAADPSCTYDPEVRKVLESMPIL